MNKGYQEKEIPEYLDLKGFKCPVSQWAIFGKVVFVGDYYHQQNNELYNIYMVDPTVSGPPKAVYLPDENYTNLWKMILEDGYIPYPGRP